MKFFVQQPGEEYNSLIEPYVEFLSKYFDRLEEAKTTFTDALNNEEYLSYIHYNKWPIRKLEYSYVITQMQKSVFKGAKLLDAGCGVSPLPFMWSDFGCNVTAIDYNKDNIKLMQQFNDNDYFNIHKRINLEVCNIINLPYDDQSFDIIVSVSVLEHLSYPLYMQAFAELYRVLKPNGVFICTMDCSRGTNKKVSDSGFTYSDIVKILNNFHCELDKESLNYDNAFVEEEDIARFWESHYYEGIGYKGNRGYTATGFVIQKKEIMEHAIWLLNNQYIEKYKYCDNRKNILTNSLNSENKMNILSYKTYKYSKILSSMVLDSNNKLLWMGDVPLPIVKTLKNSGIKENQLYTFSYKNINLIKDRRYKYILLDFDENKIMKSEQKDIISLLKNYLSEDGKIIISFMYGITDVNINMEQNNSIISFHELNDLYFSHNDLVSCGQISPIIFQKFFVDEYSSLAQIVLSKNKAEVFEDNNWQYTNDNYIDNVINDLASITWLVNVYNYEMIKFDYLDIYNKLNYMKNQMENTNLYFKSMQADSAKRLEDIFTLHDIIKERDSVIINLQHDIKEKDNQIERLNIKSTEIMKKHITIQSENLDLCKKLENSEKTTNALNEHIKFIENQINLFSTAITEFEFIKEKLINEQNELTEKIMERDNLIKSNNTCLKEYQEKIDNLNEQFFYKVIKKLRLIKYK